jgi:hypothetical protein
MGAFGAQVLPQPTATRRGLIGFLVPSPLRSDGQRLDVG